MYNKGYLIRIFISRCKSIKAVLNTGLITLYCSPKNLPYAGLLTLEKFSISSNVLVDSPMSLLTFLIEDAGFYLSDKREREQLFVNKGK